MRRDNRCRHFNGTAYNTTCDAGVVYEEVRSSGPFPHNLPCSCEDVPCAKREYKSGEELEAEEKEFTKLLTDMGIVRKAIVAATGGKRGVQGVIVCPVCQGEVSYSVAGNNGHIWAKCSTDKCVNWIE